MADPATDIRPPTREVRAPVGGSATVVAGTVARRAVWSGLLLGALFGGLLANEILGYRTNFPTAASRRTFAATLGTNRGLTAIVGPGRRLDTVEGFVTWRMFGLMIVVGAIWGLLTATRLLRGEEDQGRWELLLAGQTTRRRAAAQGVAGLALGFVALWAVVATCTVLAGTRPSVGFSASSCLFYATAGVAGAALFLAVGAVTSQLAANRRLANGLAAAAFGVSYLVRLVADASDGLAWLRWASPLGWVEDLRPLTGSQPLAALPIVVVVGALVWLAVTLADRRDVGAGILGRHGEAPSPTGLLGSQAMLAVRLERWVALAWVVGTSVLALIFGIVAHTAGQADLGGSAVEATVGQLGGNQGGAAAWMGYEFLYLAVLVCFGAAGQVAALRAEEVDGHADHLLARPVRRSSWLAGRLAVAVGLVVSAGVGCALGGWIGLGSGSGVGLGAMLRAGLDVAVPGLLVLGIGTLLFGLVPRVAMPVLYVVVLWSLLVEIIGPSLRANHWLLDTAMIAHLGPVPAAPQHWAAIGWMVALAVMSALVGAAAFARRDLTSH